VVRRVPQARLRPALRLLVAGNELGSPLMPAMKKLALMTNTQLVADLKHGTTVFDWARSGWLAEAMNNFRPTIVLLAMDPQKDAQGSRELVAYCKKFGSRVYWLVKNNESGKTSPSLSELSTWAAKIWSMITQEK